MTQLSELEHADQVWKNVSQFTAVVHGLMALPQQSGLPSVGGK